LLRLRGQRARRFHAGELALGFARALARFRKQRRIAEAGQREAREQQRNEDQRQCLLQAALVVGKKNDGDDADDAERHDDVTAVAPKLRTGRCEQEVAHAGVVMLNAIRLAHQRAERR